MSDYISQTITVSSCQSDISNQCRIKTPCITGMAGPTSAVPLYLSSWIGSVRAVPETKHQHNSCLNFLEVGPKFRLLYPPPPPGGRWIGSSCLAIAVDMPC